MLSRPILVCSLLSGVINFCKVEREREREREREGGLEVEREGRWGREGGKKERERGERESGRGGGGVERDITFIVGIHFNLTCKKSIIYKRTLLFMSGKESTSDNALLV